MKKQQDTLFLWPNSLCIRSGGHGFKSCRWRFPSIFAGSYQFAGSHQIFHEEMESKEIEGKEMEGKELESIFF